MPPAGVCSRILAPRANRPWAAAVRSPAPLTFTVPVLPFASSKSNRISFGAGGCVSVAEDVERGPVGERVEEIGPGLKIGLVRVIASSTRPPPAARARRGRA